jgi:WAS family protein 1
MSLRRYKKYVMLDPLGVVTKTRTSLEDDIAGGPAAAPSTIQQREEQLRKNVPSFLYSPGMGDVPVLSLPDFLPDLPGKFTRLTYLLLLSYSSYRYLI